MKIKKILKEPVFKILECIASNFSGTDEKKIDKKEIKRILIFEGGGIGDLLLCFPAIEAIYANFPRSSISFLVAPHSKEVLKLFPHKLTLDEIIDYDITREHKSFFKKILLINSIRKKGVDLIYAPTRGDGIRDVSLMVFLMGSPHRVGFKSGKIGFLNTNKIEIVNKLPILEQNLNLLRSSGLMVKNKSVNIRIYKKHLIFAKKLMSSCPIPIFSIHPGASWNAKYKCWPLNNYVQLIENLIHLYEASVVLVGSQKETEIGQHIIKKVNDYHLINTIGTTTIPQMAAIISNSSLFIGNDSGPLHIACALKVPCVAIFGPTSHEQLLSFANNCFVVRKDLSCSPCYLHRQDFVPLCSANDKHIECMQIPVSDVISAVDTLISQTIPKQITTQHAPLKGQLR